MAICVYVRPENLTVDQYDEVQRRLGEAGASAPKGRLHHSCFGTPDALMVYSVWESREDYDAFAATLNPIREKVGVVGGAPDFMDVHHLV
jgi:hypothetical protein